MSVTSDADANRTPGNEPAESQERSAMPDVDRRAQAFAQLQRDATERLIRDQLAPVLRQIAELEARVAELERREREDRR
jgi:hypothetical protein